MATTEASSDPESIPSTPVTSGDRNRQSTHVSGGEPFHYVDGVVRLFVAATLCWGLIASVIGCLAGGWLVLPGWYEGIPWMTYGRWQPVYHHLVIFAFVANAAFAAIYYSLQRLCGTRLWSAALGHLHFWTWQLMSVAAVATIPLGMTQGRVFAEAEWPVDLALIAAWLLFFTPNFFMTLACRRQQTMYVSVWFYAAAVVAFPIVYAVNHLLVPIDSSDSISLLAGMPDAYLQGWYRHNVLMYLLTMPFLGAMYYFLPKAAERPLYSYRLSIVHFWSIVMIAVWAAPRVWHMTAVPQWASSLGMVFGLMLWMPSWAGVINGLLTLRGASRRVLGDPVLVCFVVAIGLYGVTTVEAVLYSLKSVNAWINLTDFNPTRMEATAWGWAGMLTLGIVYWLVPRLFATELWSPRLAGVHAWIATIGVLLVVGSGYVGGFLQSVRWLSLDSTGQLSYPEFLKTLATVTPLWWLRLLGMAVWAVGMILMAGNLVLTWTSRPAKYSAQVHHPATDADQSDGGSAVTYRNENLASAPVLDAARRFDEWGTLGWHRGWERFPFQFAAVTLVAFGLAMLIQVLPVLLFRPPAPSIATVKPYTPLELIGRDLYVSEGCQNCHTQMIRPLVAETKRYGDYSRASESFYDRPAQWGYRRVGPDLAREGGLQSSLWHYLHLVNPRDVSEASVMPSYGYLVRQPLDFERISDRVQLAANWGTPYQEELDNAPEMARRQAEALAAEIVSQGGPVQVGDVMTLDSRILALVAYLQRLGADLNAKPEPEAPANPVGGESVPGDLADEAANP